MAEQAQVAINRIYLKDLSFENPMAPKLFEGEFTPEVKVDLRVNSTPLGDSNHEVVLEMTVTGKMGDNNAFIVEIEQGGVFTIKGLTDEQLPQALQIFCPNVLFPYARTSIDGAMNQGGLPSLMLAPINFEAIYLQNQQNQQPTAQA